MRQDEMIEPDAVMRAIEAIQFRLNRASTAGDNWLLFEGDELEKRTFESHLVDAWVLLIDLINRCGHSVLLAQANEEFAKLKEDPTESKMGRDEPYLIWIWRGFQILTMLKDLHVPDKASGSRHDFDHLIKLIRNSESYITSRERFACVPCREEDVHRRLEGLLKCTYPDLLSKPPLAKPIKGFVPDSAIPSLHAFVEYKYISSTAEGKQVMDQLLADCNGYRQVGYHSIVFVIYETERVFPEVDWQQALPASEPTLRIESVVLRGVVPTDEDRRISDGMKAKPRASK